MNDINTNQSEYDRRIHQRKQKELQDLSTLLGIPVEDLGRTIGTAQVKKEESFEYKLREALTIQKDNYLANAAIISDKQGIVIVYDNSTKKPDAEKLSALVHAETSPYMIKSDILERYGLKEFKDYNFWTKDIENQFNLTFGFAPDKRRRII